jgi:hypothetical protein
VDLSRGPRGAAVPVAGHGKDFRSARAIGHGDV